MGYDVVRQVLASDVANGGTFTVGYPAGRAAGDYRGGTDHAVVSFGYGDLRAKAGRVSFSFGASNVTVTNNSGMTLAAGTSVVVQLDRFGSEGEGSLSAPGKMAVLGLVLVSLGSPITSDADGVCASQSVTGSEEALINGALASGGVATFDVPRNVVAAWTNTAVVTVTGTDEFGQVVVEASGSGTSFTGKKAFKTVTSVVFSANVTGATVGTSKVLGLPVFLPGTGHILREMEDGAAATAGTTVAGATATPTATTGDVRGTYAPNSNPDGSKAFQLLMMLDDFGNRGREQFSG